MKKLTRLQQLALSQSPSLKTCASAAFLLTSAVMSGCGGDPILVGLADQFTVKVVDTVGRPVVGANTSFNVIGFNLTIPSTTPPTPYNAPGGPSESTTVQMTDGNGTTAFFLPRHGTYSAGKVVVVNSPGGNMYGFALGPQVTVDMVTTVFYELLSHATVPITTFTVSQLQTLQAEAYNVINTNISNYWINPGGASQAKLHRAYQNALADNQAFIQDVINAALANSANYSLFGMNPYQRVNHPPNITNIVPTNKAPNVVETALINMQATGFDPDGDTLFYNWVVTATPPTIYTLSSGTLRYSDTGANMTSNYNFNTDYNTVQWYQASQTVYLTAVLSDGGSAKLQIWTVSAINKERQPIFTTTAPTTVTEDQLWAYTPSATSPDGAPVMLSLANPYPTAAGDGTGLMDMCVSSGFYMANPPPGRAAYATLPTWHWQIAGSVCATPNLITWTPNNCQSGPVISPDTVSVSAVDAVGSTSVQSIPVNVLDINTVPIITSAAPNATITGPFALIPPLPALPPPPAWTYAPTVVDPETAPAANTPGEHGCADVLTYSLTAKPLGATIDPVTGLVGWTPAGDQVGNNAFTMKVVDKHGGVATQSWVVHVNDANDAPQINATCALVAHEASTTTPYKYVCGFTPTQWTQGSKFQLTTTGKPAAMTQNVPPGLFQTQGFNFNIYWNPVDTDTTFPAVASWNINLQVCNDGEGGTFAPQCTNQLFTLSAPKEDIAPKWATSPPVTVMGGCLQADCAVVGPSHYTYSASVNDGNTSPADTFVYNLTQPLPAGAFVMTTATISSTAPTGTYNLDWQVNNDTDVGSHTVTLKATSGLAATGGPQSATQSWTVYVQETNRIPYFDVIPGQTGQDGTPYTYNFGTACHTNAVTSPNKILSYSLQAGAPSGMTINTKTGVVNWNPSPDQARGPQPVNYTVLCKSKLGNPFAGNSVTVPVNLTYVNLPPTWVNVPSQIIGVGQAYSLALQATDIDGDTITLTATGLPAGSSFVPSGDSALFSWTPTIAQNGMTVTVSFKATDSSGPLTTTMPVTFQVVNTPVVLSHPVIRGTASNPYHYEVHALDPAGGGITFSVDNNNSPLGVSVTPIGGSTTSAIVSWTPSISFGGDNILTINLADSNGAVTTHSWHVNVSAGGETPPNITGLTPTTNPIIGTEGLALSVVAAATDSEGDILHYAFYWDGKWVSDASATFNYTPLSTEAGDHILTTAVTDGASADVTLDTPVHVRDALPVLGATANIVGGPFNQFLINSKTAQIFAKIAGGSPAMQIFNESSITTGPITSIALPSTMQRMALKNDLFSPTDYVVYFAGLGDLMAGANTFAGIDSTGAEFSCAAGACFGPNFLQGYAFSDGTHTTYVPGTSTAYYIKSSGRRYIGRYVSGVPGPDIDLGVGASANALLYDSVNNKVFVSVGGTTNQVMVISPASNTVTAAIGGVGNNPSPLVLNSTSGKLYVYSPSDGAISEILTSTSTLNFKKAGFATSAVIGADPLSLMVENTDDDIIYLGLPDQKLFVIYDVNNASIHSISLSSGPDQLGFDIVTHTSYGASFSGNVLFRSR